MAFTVHLTPRSDVQVEAERAAIAAQREAARLRAEQEALELARRQAEAQAAQRRTAEEEARRQAAAKTLLFLPNDFLRVPTATRVATSATTLPLLLEQIREALTMHQQITGEIVISLPVAGE